MCTFQEENMNTQSHLIIHGAAGTSAAIGGGLAQIPFSDNVPLMALQVGMAMALAKIYDIELTEGTARGMVKACLAGMTGPVIARALSQAIFGWVPAFGNGVNATTAALITESLGWSLVYEFTAMTEKKAA